MERTATAEAAASSTPSGAHLPPDPHPGLAAGADAGADGGAGAGAAVVFADLSQPLDGIPQQREPTARAAGAASAVVGTPIARPDLPRAPRPGAVRPGGLQGLCALLKLRPWWLLPSPTATPFTFAYAALLAVTSLVARYTDSAVMDSLYRSSSTDVAHLVRAPLLVLPASALWIAGGVASPYTLCFLLVLTALEHRTGGLRTAGVFLFGHVLATVLTEVPVGLAVLAGHLPDSSLHRLDYGISYGVATCVGALSGLLSPWLRWPMLVLFAGMVLEDMVAFTDPMTSWGHLISVGLGIATWPLVRRWSSARAYARAWPAPRHSPIHRAPTGGA